MKQGFSLRSSDGGQHEPAGIPIGHIGIQSAMLRRIKLDEKQVARAAKDTGLTDQQVRDVLESLASV